MLKKPLHQISFGLFLLVIICIPLFWELDKLAFYSLDESFFAIKAWDWLKEGKYNLQYIPGDHNYYNTKPYLLTWIQAFIIDRFGFSEWLFRLPSAIAGLLTCFLLLWFARKEFHNTFLGILTVLILITSGGYVNYHVTRTADSDAPVILFLVTALVFFYRYLKYNFKTTDLILFTFALLAATMIKSIYGLVFIPGMVLYSLYKQKLKSLIKQKQLYVAVGVFILAVVSYYVYRESVSPGYIAVVLKYELGRYGHELHIKFNGYFYYLQSLYEWQFSPWIFVLPIGIISVFTEQFKKYKDFVILCLFSTTILMLMVSTSQTQLKWYNAPVIPLYAFIAGLGIYITYLWLETLMNFKAKNKVYFTVFFLLAVFAFPYYKIINQINEANYTFSHEYFADLVKAAKTTKPEITRYSILEYGQKQPHIAFYEKFFQENDGLSFQSKGFDSRFKVGEKMIVCEKAYFVELDYKIEYEILEKNKGCKLIRILYIKK
ncbi:MAG: ArnT family glycosyltransferase [Cytophagaceae bacterium]